MHFSPFPKIIQSDANLSKHFTGQIQPTQQTTKNLSTKKTAQYNWPGGRWQKFAKKLALGAAVPENTQLTLSL